MHRISCTLLRAGPRRPRLESPLHPLLLTGRSKGCLRKSQGPISQLVGGSKVYLFSYSNKMKQQNKNPIAGRDELGEQYSCCLEVEVCRGLPALETPGASPAKGSGIEAPQLTGFISYLHFPLAFYMHACIFSMMECCRGDLCKHAHPRLPGTRLLMFPEVRCALIL